MKDWQDLDEDDYAALVKVAEAFMKIVEAVVDEIVPLVGMFEDLLILMYRCDSCKENYCEFKEPNEGLCCDCSDQEKKCGVCNQREIDGLVP